MQYKFAMFLSDWNFELVHRYIIGIRRFLEEHDNVTLHIFDNFGIYGEGGSNRTKSNNDMEIFNLPNVENYDAVLLESDQQWPDAIKERVIEKPHQLGIPVASLNYPIRGCTFVGTDNYTSLYDVTTYLLKEKNIKHPCFIKGLEKSIEAVRRRQGFLDACKDCGIEEQNIRMAGGSWLMETGVAACKEILDGTGQMPDAYICANDDLAAGVIKVLEERRIRVPEDVLVTGFDNLDVALYHKPQIMTVERHYENMASRAMQFLLDRVEEKSEDRTEYFSPYELVPAESSGDDKVPVEYHEMGQKHLRMTQSLETLYMLQSAMQPQVVSARDITDVMEIFEQYASVFRCRNMYLALNPDFLEKYGTGVNLKKYPEKMQLMAVAGESGPEMTCQPRNHVYETYPTEKLLPDKLMSDSRLMVFYPLHRENQNLGYVALDGVSPSSEFNILEVILTMLASSIVDLQARNYMRRMNRKLEELYVRDPLTGLYNRFGYNQYGRKFCEEQMAAAHGVHYYFIDMDDMKQINDNYDHDMGDLAIKTVAEVIGSISLINGGFCMRYGGDEFLLITRADHPITDKADDHLEMDERIRKNLQERSAQLELPFVIKASVGEFRSEDFEQVSIEECISIADERMYLRKRNAKRAVRAGIGYEMTDSLTGLLTMHEFRNRSVAAMERVRSLNRPVSVLYFDIRDFKTYNDDYGYEEGDELLKKVAAIISHALPERLVARFSADHIVALAYDHEIDEVLKMIRIENQAIRKHRDFELKAGICSVRKDAKDCMAACDRAKLACDSIRLDYTKDVQYYDGHLRELTHERKYIINNVRLAIQKNWIEAFYQPVVDVENRQIISYEALARWNDPVYGWLSPGSFIDVLEKYKLIQLLDTDMFELACGMLRERKKQNAVTLPVSVNLSRVDFEQIDPFEMVEEIVNRYGLDRSCIHIEVTESTIIQDPRLIKRKLKQFHRAGYQIWMDDFGSGYSSYNVLKEYDFDVLKIDMKFLHARNEKADKIIKSIVHMGKDLGMKTLMEGVETEEQFAFIKSIGCDMAQGYLFGKPEKISIEEKKK